MFWTWATDLRTTDLHQSTVCKGHLRVARLEDKHKFNFDHIKFEVSK